MVPGVSRRVLEPLLTVICPVGGCVLVGLLAYGTRTFHPRAPSFQFVVVGLIVGVLMLVARRLSLVRFLGASVLITVAMIIVVPFSSVSMILHTVILAGALAGAVCVNAKVVPGLACVGMIGKFIAWTLVFIFAYFLGEVTLLIIFRVTDPGVYLLAYGKQAILTGIGLGIGFKMEDWLVSKLFMEGSLLARRK